MNQNFSTAQDRWFHAGELGFGKWLVELVDGSDVMASYTVNSRTEARTIGMAWVSEESPF